MKFSRSLMLGIPLLASLALLAHASADLPDKGLVSRSVCDSSQAVHALPTKLDYVVLASVADAPNSFALYASVHSAPMSAAPTVVR